MANLSGTVNRQLQSGYPKQENKVARFQGRNLRPKKAAAGKRNQPQKKEVLRERKKQLKKEAEDQEKKGNSSALIWDQRNHFQRRIACGRQIAGFRFICNTAWIRVESGIQGVTTQPPPEIPRLLYKLFTSV